jgi:hypothetical protein
VSRTEKKIILRESERERELILGKSSGIRSDKGVLHNLSGARLLSCYHVKRQIMGYEVRSCHLHCYHVSINSSIHKQATWK